MTMMTVKLNLQIPTDTYTSNNVLYRKLQISNVSK